MSILVLLNETDTTDLREEAVQRVGRLLRARTVDSDDNQIGAFNDDTRPTGSEVGDFVDDAAQDVFITAGQQTGDKFTNVTEPAAWVLVAIRAAMLIELSYWPQQTDSADSAYQQLRQLYEDGMRNLVSAVEQNTGVGATRMASVPLVSATLTGAADLGLDIVA